MGKKTCYWLLIVIGYYPLLAHVPHLRSTTHRSAESKSRLISCAQDMLTRRGCCCQEACWCYDRCVKPSGYKFPVRLEILCKQLTCPRSACLQSETPLFDDLDSTNCHKPANGITKNAIVFKSGTPTHSFEPSCTEHQGHLAPQFFCVPIAMNI